jgi:hypothetical protein
MSNDDTQNMVYLKINITDKSIVGIGKSTSTIDVVSIPIKLDNDEGIQKLKEYLQTTTAKIIPSNMSIETFGNNDLVKKTEAGQKIARLIEKLTNENATFAKGLTESNGLTEQVNQAHVERDNIQTGGATEPNTPLGKEIYSKWTARYRAQYRTGLKTAMLIPDQAKTEMKGYIDDLTTELDDQVAAIEAAPATEQSTETATEVEVNAPPLPLFPPPSTGGKHTKRNKRNKHRKTKRRQSRNT